MLYVDLPDFLLKLPGIFSNNSFHPVKMPVKVNSCGCDPALQCHFQWRDPARIALMSGDRFDPTLIQASRLYRSKPCNHCRRSGRRTFRRGIAIGHDILAGNLAIDLCSFAHPCRNKHQSPHLPYSMGPFDALGARGANLHHFRPACISVLCDRLQTREPGRSFCCPLSI